MKEILCTFLIYSIIGTILHFTYKLSKRNIIVGFFSSINESTWEHIKLLLTPIFLYNTIKYLFGYQTNYFIMLLLELLTAIVGIITFYKIKLKIIGNKLPIINILIFYITALLCSIFGYYIQNIYINELLNIISAFGSMIIYILYILFTVCPPKNNLFKDPITGSYGINCVKN